MTDRIPLAAAALALALPLSVPTSALAIAFANFQGRAQVAVYDSANPAATVLRADAPSFVPGVTRTLEVAPSPGGPGVVEMQLVPAWVGSYNDELYLSADGGQALSGTLSYGLDRPTTPMARPSAWTSPFRIRASWCCPCRVLPSTTQAARPCAGPIWTA